MPSIEYNRPVGSELGEPAWLRRALNIFWAQPAVWILSAVMASAVLVAAGGLIVLLVSVSIRMIGLVVFHLSPVSLVYDYLWYPAFVVCSLGFALIFNFFSAGGLAMATKAIRGNPVSFGDVFSGSSKTLALFRYNLPFTLTYAICAIAIAASIADRAPLLVIPAPVVITTSAAIFLLTLIANLLYIPGQPLIIDGFSLHDAVQLSVKAVRKNWWDIFSFYLGIWAFGTISICLFGIGLIVFLPVAVISFSLVACDVAGLPKVDVQFEAVLRENGSPSPDQPGAWPPPPVRHPNEQHMNDT